jgi:hypothetical protein
MKLYLEITQDDLALPLKVCTSVNELARLVGKTPNEISSYISHNKKKKFKYPRFIKVEVEE